MPNQDETRKLLAALEASQRGGVPLQQLLSAGTNTASAAPSIPSWDTVPSQAPSPPPAAPKDPRIGRRTQIGPVSTPAYGPTTPLQDALIDPFMNRSGGMSPALASIARLLTQSGSGAPARASAPQAPQPPPRWLPEPPSDIDLLMQALSGKAPPPVQPIGTPPGLSQKAMRMPSAQLTTPVPRDKPRGQWEF